MDLVGKMLAGRYEILEEVGKGGMAHVYKAHCHFLNRPVAIKVLKEELRNDKEFVQRFNTEAQAAARITNPHIVSIYDVGVENGLYYIVMEYVEGITLKEYISDKRVLPWKQAANFAAQICEGLDAAHKKSVIHRDIKPQNIIMTKGDVLKITDFGIARASTQATITTSNSTIGTVHYLSPEQARGGYTNERTDIYSLGVVLYEMLTGRLPFDDNTAVAIAIKHIQEKPILPRILNNDIPQAMEDIVMKALNKEQDRRYMSAADFLDDLRRVIKNPNAKLSAEEPAEDDIGVTRKHAPIDMNKQEYKRRVEAEVAEREMRNIDRRRAVREQKKKERRVTFAAIAVAVAVIAVLAIVFSAVSGGGVLGVFTKSEKMEIPNIVDMKLTDAQNKYNIEGISILKASEKASDLPAGTILEQDPAAGESVIKRDDIIIRVVVSAGEQNKTVGKYTEMDVDEAKAKIARDGFKINIVEVESSSEKEGTVISQSPAEGAKATEGAMITLNVSKGDKKDEDKEDKDKDEDKSTSSNKNDSNTNSSSNSNSSNNSSSNTSDNTSGKSNGNTSSNTNTNNNTNSNNSAGETSNSSGNGGTGSATNGGTSGGTGGGESTGSNQTIPSLKEVD